MKRNLILGGGVAGLIAAFYNPDYEIIDSAPLGQLNALFSAGPRIIIDTVFARNFLNKLGIEYQTHEVIIGYTKDGYAQVPFDDNFKQIYAEKTHNTKKLEKSFLSSGSSIIYCLSDGTDEFYNNVFKKVYEIVRKRNVVTNSAITNIDLKNKLMQTKFDEFEYVNCISTLNLKIFCKLAQIDDIHPQSSNKHFVFCTYNNERDVELSKRFSYIYSITGWYTRKTYFKNYISYELSAPYENFSNAEGNKVIGKFYNAPFQIVNSIDIRNIGGIEMLGRYAQWNHSIKSNEIINYYESRQ